MRLGVVGSRTITDYDKVKRAIYRSPWWMDNFADQHPGVTIVSGGAEGVDTSAEQFAEEHGCSLKVLKPDYDDWSGGHPAKTRNTRIVEESAAIVAVWDGQSNGTRDTIDKALDRGVNLYVETLRR